MRTEEVIEQVFVSTKRGSRLVKLDPHPQGNAQSAAGRRPRRRRRRALSSPITVTLVWRGGSEASWVFKDPGMSWRYPGHWALHDVIAHWYSMH